MGKKLYIGNLPYSANDQFLTDTFSEAGTVASAKVIMDRESGRSKGFGFVEMGTDEEAAKAIQNLDGATCEGRQLKVMEARPQEPRTNTRSSGASFGGQDNRRGGGW